MTQDEADFHMMIGRMMGLVSYLQDQGHKSLAAWVLEAIDWMEDAERKLSDMSSNSKPREGK